MQSKVIVECITDWLRDYSRRSRTNGFVVGVSGGIDSAVTSTLCARTGRDVLALNMPIRQAPAQLTLATCHIRWLQDRWPNVTGITTELTPVLDTLERVLPPDIQDGLTMANSRSRIRMLTLYAFAGHHKMLVVGTGNKIEDFGVGFFTKYGDGGVDISPIADLTKTEVFAVGRELGVRDSILEATPTDGLWDDSRSDEGQLGATYPELEWAMQFSSDEPGASDKLSTRQREVLEIYSRYHKTNSHKMVPIPVCTIPDDLRQP